MKFRARPETIKLVRSLPARGAWIEIGNNGQTKYYGLSLPARGAWIEIDYNAAHMPVAAVAPREGSVD